MSLILYHLYRVVPKQNAQIFINVNKIEKIQPREER